MVIKITAMDVSYCAEDIVQDKGHTVIEELMAVPVRFSCFLQGPYILIILQVVQQASLGMVHIKICQGLVFCTWFMWKGLGFTESPGQALVVVMCCFCKEFAVFYAWVLWTWFMDLCVGYRKARVYVLVCEAQAMAAFADFS